MQEIKKLQYFPLNAVIEMITFKLFITKFPTDEYRIPFLITISKKKKLSLINQNRF